MKAFKLMTNTYFSKAPQPPLAWFPFPSRGRHNITGLSRLPLEGKLTPLGG